MSPVHTQPSSSGEGTPAAALPRPNPLNSGMCSDSGSWFCFPWEMKASVRFFSSQQFQVEETFSCKSFNTINQVLTSTCEEGGSFFLKLDPDLHFYFGSFCVC